MAEIEHLLRKAQETVTEAGVDAEFRSAAFQKVLDLLIDSETESIPAMRRPSQGGRLEQSGPTLQRIADALGLSQTSVEELYVEENGDLGLTIPSRRLATKKALGAKQIALLVAAGRQTAGLDEGWTHVEHIRAVCKHYGRFDDKNFGSTLASMDESFQIKGKGADREVRLRQQGLERAVALIQQLADRAE